MIYGTYLGGSEFNWASGIAVNASGNSYVSGQTTSPDFPLVNPIQGAFAGASDAFISEIGPTGMSLPFSTLYGGTKADAAGAIAVDSFGNIFVGGQTSSVDLHTVAPFQPVNSAGATGWLTRLGSGGPSSSARAEFVRLDITTQGSWKGVYGTDGYK